jgi:hypothetical protein
MLYKNNFCASINDYEIKEYKNGYFLGLVGSNSTVRIFVAKSIIINSLNFIIQLQQKFEYIAHSFYINNYINNYFFKKKKMSLQSIKNRINTLMTNLVWKFQSILWFKGRNFQSNKAYLFINNGRIKQPKFLIPKNLIWNLSKKRKFLRFKANSSNFMQLYTYLLHQILKPNTYTGKGIRIRGLLVRKKLGKRKTY